MTMITQFAPEVRVFRWNATLPANNSCGGVVVMRCTTTVLRHSKISPKFEHIVTAPYSISERPEPFQDLYSTKKLLGEVFERIPFLRPCKNFNTVVHKLAEDLFCKFRLGPKLSSNRENNPKLVILLDVETVVSTEKPDPFVDIYDMNKSIWENEQSREAIADDEGMIPKEIKEVEDFLEGGRRRIEAFEPKGLDEEVKPAVGIEMFSETDEAGNGDDSEQVDEICSVCLEKLSAGVVVGTSCSHKFHKTCVFKWLLGSKTSSCPMCRSSLVIPI